MIFLQVSTNSREFVFFYALVMKIIGVRAHSDLGGGAVIFLPEKNYTMPECVSVEIWI